MSDDPTSGEIRLGDEQGLDRSRRYLRPVARLPLPEEPNLVHLAVYEWLPAFEAWATGPALCGRSAKQGPLAGDVEVTCLSCLAYQPKYQAVLALQAGPARPAQPPTARSFLHEQVRDVVRAAGLKQAWIAQQLDVSEKHLSQLLTGRAPMTLEWAEQILALTGKRLRVVIEDAA